MSPSEESTHLADLLGTLHSRIAGAMERGEIARVPPDEVTSLMSEAVRLYATVMEETERDIPVIDASISTTEAMVAACALLRAHRLTPFDLALWFSRTAPRNGASANDT